MEAISSSDKEHKLHLLGGLSSLAFFTFREKAHSDLGYLPSTSYTCNAFIRGGDWTTTSFSPHFDSRFGCCFRR